MVDEASGELSVTKVRSSHPTPDTAVIAGVEQIGEGGVIPRLDYFVHGTTVGLNAVIEGRGPRLAMFATRGFRDVLEMRRSNQTEDPYNLFWHPRPPLIPRALRFPIGGRISAAGEVVAPLVPEDVERALAEAADAGAEGIVVAFINAYVNPEHEREVERILRDLGYEGEVTLSHRVSREHREYERTSTATVNGFIRPHVSDYLVRLAEGLSQRGFAGTSLITRSGGGALTFAEGEQRPFETLLSGPVAGVEGAAYLGRRLDRRQIITADVGGTSFDTALVLDGRPIVKHEGEIAGMPVQTPWVDVRSIGAGGGSIASVDAGGLLRVGPRSAGSDPGPAAYGSGGTEPTVTDAAVALGMFPVADLSGEVTLDAGLAEAALRPLGDRLGLSVQEVAVGILRIAASKMADAIREITVESGEDPRTAVLVAFGGAGPLFATQLADELNLAEVVVPPFAGVFSAWGLLVTDAVQVRSQTRLLGLDDAGLAEAEAALAELYEEIAGSTEEPASPHPATRVASLDLRYVGQEHHLTVPIEVEDGRILADAAAIEGEFADRYLRAFGAALPAEVEVVAVRAEIRRSLRDSSSVDATARSAAVGAPAAQARAYSMQADDWREFQVVDRAGLAADAAVSGPALLVEGTTITYVDEGYEACLGEIGTVHLTRGGAT
ncbi:MAG: hydantoinase/oxoprolinase family protein [Actinobacteria bacterium]|nr:hydantoinase/oxoprolinase family protein [Actinomycetota bacterium]